MLQSFNQTVFESGTGKSLKEYLHTKMDNPFFENLSLEDENAIPQKIFDTSARVNMIIVWASWCGPCIQEIPDIATLNNSYASKGLSITNVSIDENKKLWQNALSKQKMSWRQFIVTQENLKNFNEKFEVGSIPYVIFLNNKGKLITRFIGYERNRINEYRKIIEENLH